MKLYSTPRAPNPQRVEMFMAEKNITDVEIVPVSLMNGEHRSANYKSKSPLSQVPALEFPDGRVLTESRAICRYLEGAYPEPNLMGASYEEQAFIEMWDRRMELSVFVPISNWIRHTHPALTALEDAPNAAWGATSEDRARRIAVWLDGQLANKRYIAGQRFTIADITAYCALEFGRMMKFRPWTELPHLAAWRDLVGSRASAQKLAA